MADETEVTAHRDAYRVPIIGGEKTVKVRPWTMKQRAELKPLLASVAERLTSEDLGMTSMTIAKAMLVAEEELFEIAKISAELPDDTTWDELYWEDLPNIVQAVWETSIVTIAGGGLAGKAIGLLTNVLRTVNISGLTNAAIAEQAAKANGADTSTPKTESTPN